MGGSASAMRRILSGAAIVMVAAGIAACGSPQEAAAPTVEDTTPYKVGLVYSQTGALASYGQQYAEGFKARAGLRDQGDRQGRQPPGGRHREAVIGGAGATVSSILVPAAANEFTTFAKQALDTKPDLLFVAWAGTTAPAMWQALDQQGVLGATTVVTGLDIRASWPTFGAAGTKISFLAHYFDGAVSNDAYNALKGAVPGGKTDLFHPDGSPPPR
jgi:hypothetical protein